MRSYLRLPVDRENDRCETITTRTVVITKVITAHEKYWDIGREIVLSQTE